MNKIFTRLLSLILVIILFFSLSFNVSAAEYEFYSINVLDYSYMNNSDKHYASLTSSENSFFYEMPFVSRLYQSEMLFKVSGSQDSVSSVTIKDTNNHTFTPDLIYVGQGYYRLLWSSGGYFIEKLTFNVNFSNSSTSLQVLSFNVSPSNALFVNPVYNAYVGVTEDGDFDDIRYENVNTFSTIGELFGGESFRTDIYFTDWKQYDFLDYCFSFNCATVTSVQVILDNDIVVPFEVQEIYSNSSNANESVFTFVLHIDLTTVPRDGELSILIRGTCDQDVDIAGPFSVTCNSCCGYIKADSFSNPITFWLNSIWTKLSIGFTNTTMAIQKLAQSITSDLSTNFTNLLYAIQNLAQSISLDLVDLGTTIVSSLDSFQERMASNFNSLFTRISNFKISVESKFDELISHLDPAGADEPADEMQDKLDDQTNEMNDITNSMDSVSKPSSDDLDLDLDGFVSNSNLTLATKGLSNILGNEIILQLFIMIITFAIVGYILFGKR